MVSIWYHGFFAAAALVATAANAQEPLVLQTGQAWTHVNSGIVIPAALDELPRVRATSAAAPELDIIQNFASDDGRESLTIQIFRDTNGSVPLWFAQAERAIMLRADLKNPVLAVPVIPFTPPGQTAASGLKAVFSPDEVEGIRSTGVALFAVNGWYVKLRANSASLIPSDMSDWMEGVIAELTLPPGDTPAAAAIVDCKSKLDFSAASIDSTLPDAVLTAGVKDAAARIESPRWCLDRVVRGNQAVYRPDDASDRYLFAAGDSGKAFTVQSHGAATTRYHSVNFLTADRIFTLPAQASLPPPLRVLELASAKRSVATITTWPLP